MGRDLSNVFRHMQRNASKRRRAPRLVGRPVAMAEAQIDRLVRVTESIVKAADRKYQIACKTVRHATKFSCIPRAVYNARDARGVRFHPMRDNVARAVSGEGDRLSLREGARQEA